MDGRVDIVTLNKEQEVNLIQSGALRSQFFKDTHKPLVFIHFSDIHAALPLWNRVAEFMNYYQEYIAFALMTGDYCEDSQKRYVDLYGNGIKTKNPILNCAGNHDTCADETHGKATKQSVYQLLFATTDTKSWGVTFMEGDCSMTYYKDFPESNIRLVVLDYYYDIDVQAEWLTGILEESKENGYQVITAMHEVSHPIVNKVECTFQTRNDYERLGGNRSKSKFETVIHRFKQDGGTHICNLVGHEHSDMIGYTEKGVLNIAVECATDWIGWSDGKRVRGTKMYDCFNVVAVDANLGLIKLVRIGNNTDHYLRQKNVLCYDYINREIISNH